MSLTHCNILWRTPDGLSTVSLLRNHVRVIREERERREEMVRVRDRIGETTGKTKGEGGTRVKGGGTRARHCRGDTKGSLASDFSETPIYSCLLHNFAMILPMLASLLLRL